MLKIGHNIKFDLQVFAQHGITTAPIDDTMLMSYVLQVGRCHHGMDELAERHLDHATIKFDDVVGTAKAHHFRLCPPRPSHRLCRRRRRHHSATAPNFKPMLISERLSNVYEP
ncbi:hypothetical protein CCP2SC5_1890002 [Azospirillaceae bacterium]